MCRDAAALACVCRAAAAAALASKWRSAVRVGRSGAVLEPASGTFDVTVAPGEDVQAAADRCPPGGCMLLLPGTHDASLVLPADKEVHVFGRGRATLRSAAGTVVTSSSAVSTIDGIVVRQERIIEGIHRSSFGVAIEGGALRVQACDISSASDACIFVTGGAGTDPVVTGCKCVEVAFALGEGGGDA